MPRKVKSNYLGGRVDDDLKEEVQEYIDNAGITEGELIRAAVKEYMDKHKITEEN